MNCFKGHMGRFLSVVLLFAMLFCTFGCAETPDRETPAEKGIPVLTYHRVATHEMKEKHFADNKWVNDLDDFKANMKYLYENGYRTLSMKEFDAWYRGEVDYDTDKTVLLTFDDGDMENYYNVLPVLKEYNMKATVFVVGDRVKNTDTKYDGIHNCYMTAEIIEKMRTEYPDFEIQSHTYGMHYQDKDGTHRMKKATKKELQEDFKKMKDLLNSEYVAYPYGVKTDITEEAFAESGYRLGFGFGQPDLPYRRAKRTDNRCYISRIKVDANTGKAGQFEELLK